MIALWVAVALLALWLGWLTWVTVGLSEATLQLATLVQAIAERLAGERLATKLTKSD